MTVQRDPDSARAGFNGTADEILDTGSKHMKLSKRQLQLNELWSYFRVAEHDGKGIDWEGHPVVTSQQRDTVSRTHYTPPGYDNVSDLPRNFRRPVAPLGIIRNIVSRFTGLLFSNRKQPRMTVPGDQKTEDYLQAIIQYGGFWPAMIQARNYGGAMGAACIGFRFINGKCTFEALDPRWTTPEFVGRGYTEPTKLTVQYTYSKEVQDDEGKYKAVWYWYRRVIDTETDTVWVPIRCKDKEPNWEYMQRNTVRHGLGFVPYEWIQNLQDDDDCDGDPDCSGCYDLVNVIDQLLAEVYTGTVKNCLGAETEFITSEGVRKFADFRDNDRITVLTHTGRWRQAIVKSYGEQQLYAVRVGRGRNSQTIRATANHRWILESGEVTVNLRPGQKLWKPPHLIRDWSYEEAPDTEKLYWAQGFAFGDGGKAGPGSQIRLCGAKARFVSRFGELGCDITYPPSYNHDPLVYLRGYQKTLPSLREDGYRNVMAFVRGYLDADGSRNLKHPETSDINPFQGIQVTGKEAIRFVREVFPAVGAYIVAEDDRTEQATNFGKRTDDTVYFSLVLGFSNSPVAPYTVREITPDAVETVWCLEVEDDQSFVLPSGVVTANCDPTLMLVTDAEFKDIQKGSDNAIKLNSGGSGSYLELGGNGARIGLEVIKDLEDRVYRLAQCVPDSVLYQNSGEKTATEIERIFSSMLEKADSLREQYGPAMTKVCQKVLKAVRLYTQIRELPDGRLVRGRIDVPPKVIQQPDGDTVEIPRNVGKGTLCDIKWPPYFRPTMSDADTASRVITTLLTSDPKLITKTTAVRFMAPLMDYDPLVELHALKKEEQDAAMAEEAAGAEGEEGAEGGEAPEEEAEDPTTAVAGNPASWKAALDAGIVTLNEYREKALGLGAIPDGDLTMVQYRAKYSEVFVANTAATSEKMVDMVNGKFQADQDDKVADREEKAAQAEQAAKEKAEALKAGVVQPGVAGTSPSAGQPGQPPGRRNSAPVAKPSGRAAPQPPAPKPKKAED